MDALDLDPELGESIAQLGAALLQSLAATEATLRQLHPPELDALRPRLEPVCTRLGQALEAFRKVETPDHLESFHQELIRTAELSAESLAGFAQAPRPEEGIGRAIHAMHQHARAQAALYPLRHALPPVAGFFAEPFRRSSSSVLEASPDSEARVGLFRGEGALGAGVDEANAPRGGFDLYVPESWDGEEALPLIMALHGGAGNGADFLWTWLREARSRRCLLIAPTSRGSTWSLHAPEIDGQLLVQMVEWVDSQWCVDRERVLLTGLSDGGTMTLLVGLGADTPFTHLAPIAGVLHPLNFAIGNLDRARDRPIQLIHGTLDWMFPVRLAREAAGVLEDAGAALDYTEIANLSHTYPREENARLIEWLDPQRTPSHLSEPTSS